MGTNSRLLGGNIGPFKEGLDLTKVASGCLGESQEICLASGDTGWVLRGKGFRETTFCSFFSGKGGGLGSLEGSVSVSSGMDLISSNLRGNTGERIGECVSGTGVVFRLAVEKLD